MKLISVVDVHSKLLLCYNFLIALIHIVDMFAGTPKGLHCAVRLQTIVDETVKKWQNCSASLSIGKLFQDLFCSTV